jgi:phage tail-like protein
MADASVPAQNPPSSAGPADVDPYRAYQFKLIIDGTPKGHFTRVTGMGIHIDPIAYREGGENQTVRQLVGRTTYDPVTLWFGLIKADTESLWQWLMRGVAGDTAPKNVSIVVLGAGGSGEKVRYNLNGAWPSHWRGAELDAMSRDIAVEQLTLVYESLTRL